MKKIKSTILNIVKNYTGILILVSLTAYLCFKSYTPNTFLTGWDTLHPEFNFSHAFQSLFWGAWRQDQGLGAIAAHSHMSEFPRIIYLWLASKIFTVSFLRYSYIFICLILGPVGMFYFLKRFLKENNATVIAGLGALVGAAYYLLNLGTVQRFSVPFEMFTAQFAMLPWAFLTATLFLETNKKKYLGLFALVSFLGSSQAYAATLFYAYSFLFGLTMIFYVIQSWQKKGIVKQLILIALTLFATNAYWFLPNVYSVVNQSREVSNAHINELFTPEAVLHNQAWGNFTNVISQKNYLFSWQAYDFANKTFADLLGSWNAHLSNPQIAAIPLVFALLSLLGIIVALYKREKIGVALIIPTLLSLFFLMNTNGPIGFIYSFVQNHSGLFAEAFRDPFTKFSTIFSFFMSYYIAFFLSVTFNLIKNIKKLFFVPVIISFGLVISLGILIKPAFENGFVSPLMRISIPHEYFDAFKFFDGTEGRIAQLPLNSMWGWQYNSWGYQGAGFFWFGVNNPYLTRDFDRWSASNETFYNEAARAYYAKDVTVFETLLQKYNIHYLLLDGSVFDPGSESKSLSTEAQEFLSKVPSIRKVATFGFINIYKTSVTAGDVSTPTVFSKVNADSTYTPVDYTYAQYGDYVSSEQGAWKPFINFDSRVIKQTRTDDWMTLTATTHNLANEVLTIPDIVKRESVLPVAVSVSRNKTDLAVRFDLIQPKISADGVMIEPSPVYLITHLRSNSQSGYLSIEATVFDLSSIPTDGTFHDLGNMYVNSVGKTKLQLFTINAIKNSTFLNEIKSKNASWCSDPTEEGGLTPLTSGFVLTSNDQSVCIGSLVTLSAPALYDTNFVSLNGSSSLFCLNQIGKDGCVNVMPPTATQIFGGRKVSYQTPIESGNYWFAFVGQSIPNIQTTATYDQLSLSYHPEISRNYVDFGAAYALFSSEKNISLDHVKTLSVSYFVGPIIAENFLLERGHANALNCSIPKRGEVSKYFEGDTVTFGATNGGVSCDYFDYPQLLQTQAYVMTVTGENTVGRSIKFYVQNTESGHMDREELVSSGLFTKEYILEPYENGTGGYVINLETRAFDQLKSQNTLTSLSFSPIPLKWLTEIAIGPKTSITTNNELKVDKVSTTGTIYTISVHGKGVIAVNEAYQKGWVAVSKNGTVLPHITVNGWGNGWEVPENTTTIYVFYAPQLLEFIGIAIGLFCSYRLIKARRSAIVFDLVKLGGIKKPH